MPSTSSNPSITTKGNGYGWEIAFEDNNDYLHSFSSFAGGIGTSIGMLTNTSPGNAPPS